MVTTVSFSFSLKLVSLPVFLWVTFGSRFRSFNYAFSKWYISIYIIYEVFTFCLRNTHIFSRLCDFCLAYHWRQYFNSYWSLYDNDPITSKKIFFILSKFWKIWVNSICGNSRGIRIKFSTPPLHLLQLIFSKNKGGSEFFGNKI